MRRRKQALKMTWRQMWPIWLTFALLFGFGVFGVLVLVPRAHTQTKMLARNEDVKVAAQELENGEPRLFAMPLASRDQTEFFLERGADDNIIVAFASCRKCYRSGHYRQGKDIYCGRCNGPMPRLSRGQTPAFEIDCTHIPIPFEKVGGNVVVRAGAVRDGFAQWYMPIVSNNRPEDARN